jgi:DNA polymerase-3 subunit delta
MAAIQPRSADAFCRKPDGHFAVILIYGPDTGLVSERARAIIAALVDDPGDPFQMVTLDGDEAAADPARLVDEALTVPLFGGRRAVWVKAGGRNLVPAIAPLLSAPPRDCRILIEGGDWKKSSPLVALVERSRAGASLACYADEAASLGQVIAEEVAAAHLTISPEARDTLMGLLGGDRLASRSEVRKLALYALGADRIELADVAAVVSDASSLVTDDIIDAAFAGRERQLDAMVAKAWGEGVNPSAMAGAALRHALLLHRLRAEVEKGRPPAVVVEEAGRQIHFRRKADIAAQLGASDLKRLDHLVEDLADTVLAARRNALLGTAIVSRALIRIAGLMRRRAG